MRALREAMEAFLDTDDTVDIEQDEFNDLAKQTMILKLKMGAEIRARQENAASNAEQQQN